MNYRVFIVMCFVFTLYPMDLDFPLQRAGKKIKIEPSLLEFQRKELLNLFDDDRTIFYAIAHNYSGLELSKIHDIDKNYLLHIAAAADDVAAIEWLLNKGVDINAQNLLGETPLHMACHHNHISAVEQLINAGSDLNKANARGMNTLHYVALSDGKFKKEIAEMLLNLGMDINYPVTKSYMLFTGKRALCLALERYKASDQDFIEFLINCNARCSQVHLALALSINSLALIKLLCNKVLPVGDMCIEFEKWFKAHQKSREHRYYWRKLKEKIEMQQLFRHLINPRIRKRVEIDGLLYEYTFLRSISLHQKLELDHRAATPFRAYLNAFKYPYTIVRAPLMMPATFDKIFSQKVWMLCLLVEWGARPEREDYKDMQNINLIRLFDNKYFRLDQYLNEIIKCKQRQLFRRLMIIDDKAKKEREEALREKSRKNVLTEQNNYLAFNFIPPEIWYEIAEWAHPLINEDDVM